jgi:hypothetical protein
MNINRIATIEIEQQWNPEGNRMPIELDHFYTPP